MFAALSLTTAAGLLVSAVAVGLASRTGAGRALAVLLGLSAASAAANALWALRLDAWWIAWPLFGMVVAAASAACPALLGLAFARGRTDGPLRRGDALLVGLFALAGAGLYFTATEFVDGLFWARFIVLNAFSVAAIAVAARVVRAWEAPGRRMLGVLAGVYAGHWASGAVAWAGAARNADWATGAEGVSVALLLAFGLAAWGVARGRMAAGAGLFGVRSGPSAAARPAPRPAGVSSGAGRPGQ